MVCVPSRSKVSDYMRLKREIDETIGRVNGKFANVNWTPIWYYYRSFGFDDLIDLYTQSDIAMVTPLRDGMNLVAKEYLATRVENDGVLILSELAGASKELHQALIVNPFDINELADSIYEAIKLSSELSNDSLALEKSVVGNVGLTRPVADKMYPPHIASSDSTSKPLLDSICRKVSSVK